MLNHFNADTELPMLIDELVTKEHYTCTAAATRGKQWNNLIIRKKWGHEFDLVGTQSNTHANHKPN